MDRNIYKRQRPHSVGHAYASLAREEPDPKIAARIYDQAAVMFDSRGMWAEADDCRWCAEQQRVMEMTHEHTQH